jgi:hypothetical protein
MCTGRVEIKSTSSPLETEARLGGIDVSCLRRRYAPMIRSAYRAQTNPSQAHATRANGARTHRPPDITTHPCASFNSINSHKSAKCCLFDQITSILRKPSLTNFTKRTRRAKQVSLRHEPKSCTSGYAPTLRRAMLYPIKRLKGLLLYYPENCTARKLVIGKDCVIIKEGYMGSADVLKA